MKILGNDVILGIAKPHAFVAFAYAKSCEVVESMDTIEVSSPTSGQWKEFIAGRSEWTMTCECLLSDDERELEEIFRARKPIDVRWELRQSQLGVMEGKVLITNLRKTGRMQEMATYSITMRGVGELASY